MVNDRLTGRHIAAPACANPARVLQLDPRRSFVALGPALVAPLPIVTARLQGTLGGILRSLALGNAEAKAFFVGAALALGGRLVLAVAVQVDDGAHYASGAIIFLGS